MRSALVLVLVPVLVATAVAAGATPPAAPDQPSAAVALSQPTFVLTGGGYGHGVGLNQYGAYGQAKANRSYRDILAFYYPGTEVAKTPAKKVRVLVADGRPAAKIGSSDVFSVRDASGLVTWLTAGEITLKADLKVVLDGKPTKLPGPLSFVPSPGSMLTLDGKMYRGQLDVAAAGTGLQVIDVVGLEAYLLGVVPGEVPKEWPAAALQAQAVAARSYALASIVKDKPYDLYSDTRSQVYYGVASETPATTGAVKATQGQILTYAGKVATTFYYSSSGGRTASSVDVFGIVTPYLQARDDPWDAISPFHRWPPRLYTATSLAQAFGLSAPVIDVQSVPTASGRPLTVTLFKRTGTRVELRAADVRARLGLRSTAFRVGVLRIGRPMPPAPPGTPVVIPGVARDVDDPLLEKLDQKGTWVPAVKVVPAEDGSFAATVRPKATATYRLTADGEPGPAVTVTVAAKAAK